MSAKTQIDLENTKKALMKLSKETLINLYISASEKADKYNELHELIIIDMVET
jgi:hypothetical protein